MDKKYIGIVIVVAVIFGAGGFFGGAKYQKSKIPAVVTRTGGQGGGRRFAGGAGNFVNGQVLSVSGTSITVKSMNGGSQIAVLAPSTQYRKAVDGSATDVTTGSMVTITGTQNSDGSITAQNVQIRTASSTQAGMPGPDGQK